MKVLDMLLCGEDSKTVIIEDLTDNSLASVSVAFSNSKGGRIFIGIKEDIIKGLTAEQVDEIIQRVSTVSANNVHPPIAVDTKVVNNNDGKVVVITVLEGLSKPNKDDDGIMWVKCGAGKKVVSSTKEILQDEIHPYADIMPIRGALSSDVDYNYFSSVYERMYQEPLDNQNISFLKLLQAMNLASQEGFLNLTCVLHFSKELSFFRLNCGIKAFCYSTLDVDDSNCMEKKDFKGNLNMIFEGALRFIMNNLPSFSQNVNSLACSIVPKKVVEELLVNAIIHRDYFISSPIRIVMFSNRVEIISPGTLPHSLTIDNIKAGNAVSRNPILSTYARYVLPYLGVGEGIRGALKLYPKIEFFNEVDNNQFKVVVEF